RISCLEAFLHPRRARQLLLRRESELGEAERDRATSGRSAPSAQTRDPFGAAVWRGFRENRPVGDDEPAAGQAAVACVDGEKERAQRSAEAHPEPDRTSRAG